MANGIEVEPARDPHAIALEEEFETQKQVDTVHGDEALKVIAAAGGDDLWSQDEEKRLVRKIDRRLMPIVCVAYGIQFWDKVMIAQAVRELPYLSIKHSCGSRVIRAIAVFQSLIVTFRLSLVSELISI